MSSQAPARVNYQAYMKSVEWQMKKDWWRKHHSSRRRRCRVCRDQHYELHHRTYRRLTNERLRDLVPLCDRHHQAVHRWERAIMRMTTLRRDTVLRWVTRVYTRRRRIVLCLLLLVPVLR